MPANLTPQYRKAEREYRRAQTAAEQHECLLKMLQLIPKHKGTDKLQADLRSRLSEARKQAIQEAGASRSQNQYRIARQGAGRIVVIGAPNCGKSRLVAELTAATPEVADFPYTTREPLPAMMDFEGVSIQLIDTPPITSGTLPPWMLNLIRTADAVALLMDGSSDNSPTETQCVLSELDSRRTRLSDTGGFDESDFAVLHVPTLLIVTHAADRDAETRLELLKESRPLPFSSVSIDFDHLPPGHPESLKQQLFQRLQLTRVYTRRPGQSQADNIPLTIPLGGTVEDLALQIHGELAASLKRARVWGQGRHDGQTVGRDHVLHDQDTVELLT
jgi:ribosome-interacting GTPase 1